MLLKGTPITQTRRLARLCILSSLPADMLGMFYHVKVFPWKRQGHSGPQRCKQQSSASGRLDRGQGKRLLNFRVLHDSEERAWVEPHHEKGEGGQPKAFGTQGL